MTRTQLPFFSAFQQESPHDGAPAHTPTVSIAECNKFNGPKDDSPGIISIDLAEGRDRSVPSAST